MIGLFFSSIIAIIFWRILIVPGAFFLAVTIAIIFFLTYRYVVSEEKEVNYNSPSLRLRKTLFSCLVVLSSLVVLFVPRIKEVEFVAWNAIPLPNLLRLLLSSFLTLFSSGYMILNLMDRDEKLTGTEKTLFSIMISLFILPFLGLLNFVSGSNILQLGIPSIILLNLILLIPYILFKRNEPKANEEFSIDLNEKIILLSLLIFISMLMLCKYSLNLTWDYGDLDTYYGYSVSFTKEVLPLSPTGPGLNYPFWPFIFLAECFILSGVPYVNAFQFVSIPITFLPILSLYIMVSAFFKESRHRKIPIIATILGFFGGGFGWIFGIHLLANSQTAQSLYDLFNIMSRTNSGYLVPSFYSAPGTTGNYPLYTYALTSIFALIWLIYSKRAIKIGNLRYVFIPLMIALGFLAHIAETVLFIFIFLTSILILKRENVSSYRRSAISIIFGLVLIALADIIVNGSYYVEGDLFTYYRFSSYYGAIAFAILAFLLSFIKSNLKTHTVNLKINNSKLRTLKIACSSITVYLYGLSLIIWSEVYEAYNRLPTQNHTVPWYAWPNRLGICGLIALLGTIYLIHKNKNVKEYSFFILLVPVSFAISRVLHVYPFYQEDRLTFFIMIPTVMLASYVLLKFGQTLREHIRSNIKNVIFGSVLSMILVSGFLPSLLAFEAIDYNYWSSGEKLSNSELDALNFLRLNTPPNGSVLTLTERSNQLLSYAGLFPVQTYVNRDPSIIFTLSFHETAIYSLMKSQLKYVYLTPADEMKLEQNLSYSGFVRDYLLKYLPIPIQNEEVTIYEIPDFSVPTNSSTALVTSNLNTGYFKDSAGNFFPLIMLALGEIEYSTVLEDDPVRLHYSTLILTHDLDLWSETEERDFQRYLQWINQGGRLIVLDSLGACSSSLHEYPLSIYPGFADLLSIYTEGTSVADGVESQISSLNFPSIITMPVIHSSDINTKNIANYTLNNKSVSPYALTKKIGKGEVIYLAVSPYFCKLENSTGAIARKLFRDMGSLINTLDLRLSKNTIKRTNYFPQFDYIKGPVNLIGEVIADTDYIHLPRLNANYIKIFSRNEKEETIDLNNSIIEKVEYTYPIKFRINASEIRLSGISMGRYLNLEIIGDFNLTMEIPKNSTVEMSMWRGTILLNEAFQESTIQLNIKNNKTSVSVKNPKIITEGETYFNRARIYRNYYRMPLFYNDGTNPFEVSGRTTFEIEYSDNGISFVDNFAFNGKWFYPATEEKQPLFNEMDIPWFSVFTSPFHTLLVSMIIAVLIAYTYLTLQRTKMELS